MMISVAATIAISTALMKSCQIMVGTVAIKAMKVVMEGEAALISNVQRQAVAVMTVGKLIVVEILTRTIIIIIMKAVVAVVEEVELRRVPVVTMLVVVAAAVTVEVAPVKNETVTCICFAPTFTFVRTPPSPPLVSPAQTAAAATTAIVTVTAIAAATMIVLPIGHPFVTRRHRYYECLQSVCCPVF